MESKTPLLERVVTIASSIMTIFTVCKSWLESQHSGWGALLFIVTIACALAAGAIMLVPGLLHRRRQLSDYGMKILSPTQDQVVTENYPRVTGSFEIKPDGNWILLTRNGLDYWPQTDVAISSYESRWSGNVWLWLPHETPHTVILAEVASPVARVLVDYFRKVEKAMKEIRSARQRLESAISILPAGGFTEIRDATRLIAQADHTPPIKMRDPPDGFRVAEKILVSTKAKPDEENPDLPPESTGNPPPISIHGVSISDERSINPPRRFPMKLKAVIHNETSDPIRLGVLDWISGSRQAQPQTTPPHGFGYCYFADGSKTELKELAMPGKSIATMWLSLNPDQDKAALDTMLSEKRLGTLVIPVSHRNGETEVRFEL
jgi:hypothetical protein